ncbi:MAG: SIS domain-containing protein [Acidimicrobiia bacterium]|nr:SIS domain-containing protein [Acidimicrobiia bacterium]
MCGIIAVLRRRSDRAVPSSAQVLELASRAEARLADSGTDLVRRLGEATAVLRELDGLLRGVPGVTALVAHPGLAAELEARAGRMGADLAASERLVDVGAVERSPAEVELLSAAAIDAKDALWAIGQDRLRTARAVATLAGGAPGPNALTAYLAIQEALSAIDRLEVRGRDSAGLHVLVRDHGLDLGRPALAEAIGARGDDLFGSGSLRVAEGCLSFVYKAAAEIGELGDNTAVIRRAIEVDDVLRRALSGPDAEAVVLGHTRWASVGIISAANAHPLNSEEVDHVSGPYVTAALNGDVDNFADLKASHGLRIRTEITTDAKVIPTLASRAVADGLAVNEAFRRTVAQLEGSVAIGGQAAASPERLLLALRGSGQALYVGVAEDVYVVASEPYGVVEVCGRYLRMDGETPSDPTNPAGSRGQVVVLDAERAGTLEGIGRWSYDGSELAVEAGELTSPQITTRDIDRGDQPHYLLKEISESPSSFRKTVRGKLVDTEGGLAVRLGEETLPAAIVADLARARVRSVVVIGQGTAAVAGQGFVLALQSAVHAARLRVEAVPATELSGFRLGSDMSDTLVVAISQSGTTTDTNRTVDLVRARGARVISIVNRRNSDLTDKSDGVLYTSDGRDVEMSVASTKAFYSQIAAGFLLAFAIADIVEAGAGVEGIVGGARSTNGAPPLDRQEVLAGLRQLPDLMEQTLELRPQVAAMARQFAPQRRYWALVGNGPNRIAAAEVRIKLSELCYKSIACDITEDKKHIDLSSEPLILVCAAGLRGSTADDVAKEVGIYRAHRAAPLVVASASSPPYPAALAVVKVPDTHPLLAFVLATMVGHLFGYEAALAIDALATPLRRARGAVEQALSHEDPEALADALRTGLEPVVGPFFDDLRSGAYDGHLEASTAARLSSLLRYGLGVLPLESYELEFGKVATPAVVVEDLTRALTQGVDELTRPVDAIKHQAKTVTVGISRSDETLLETPLVQAVLAAGAARDRLSYDTLRTLGALSPTVAEVTGYTRYRIEGRAGQGDATITVVDRDGIAQDLPLRTERNPRLRGTKHQVAAERRVLAARGRFDGRTIVIVPEVKDGQTTGITLLHVRFADRLPTAVLRTALTGYRDRFRVLEDAVLETEPAFREDLLESVDVTDLLTEPIIPLADRWRV